VLWGRALQLPGVFKALSWVNFCPAAAVFDRKAPYVEGKSLQSFLASLMVGGSIFVWKFGYETAITDATE